MMGQISPKLRAGDRVLTYWCQGCEDSHTIGLRPGSPAWDWDGNAEAPTFSPSVLSTSGHYVPDHKPGDPCWCSWNAEHPDDPGPACVRCHTFVRGGMVQFLGDCTHALAGQTLPLPDLPEHLRDAPSPERGQ